MGKAVNCDCPEMTNQAPCQANQPSDNKVQYKIQKYKCHNIFRRISKGRVKTIWVKIEENWSKGQKDNVTNFCV